MVNPVVVHKPTIEEYWNKATPMVFGREKWAYEKKRKFRYDLQNYMHDFYRFEEWYGKSVLDAGCGSGIDAMEFARNGAVVTAIDLTENAVEVTKALAEEASFPIKVHKASALGLPFSPASFDCVYSFGVLHHIPDADRALGEIVRVLKPGGTFLGMLYNTDSLLYAYSIIYRHGVRDLGLTDRTPQELAEYYSERIEGCPYTRTYTKKQAEELLSRRFTDIEIAVLYNVIDTDGVRKVKLGVDNKYELGWHLAIRATKK